MPAAVPRATSISARTAVAQPSQGAEMTRHGHDDAKPLLVARDREHPTPCTLAPSGPTRRQNIAGMRFQYIIAYPHCQLQGQLQ